MTFKQTTQIPNIFFDKYLQSLTGSEIKILLIIIRQTIGWIDMSTGDRKTKDRITQSQFKLKTGLAPRIISKTIKMLSVKEFITITDQYNNPLNSSISRKGKSFIYYSLNPMHFMTSINAQNDTRAMHKSAYNKRKKENITKRNDLPDWQNRIQTIGEILKGTGYKVSYPN